MLDPQKLSTPFFYLDHDILEKDINLLKNAIHRYWENTMVAYSVKTNSFPPLLQMLREKGICVEVVSRDEYDLVKRCGFVSDEIVCNGPIKTKEWIAEIFSENNIINIDSNYELNIITKIAARYPNQIFSVGIRVNFDIESVFPGESNGDINGIRFGFSYENNELSRIINDLQKHENIIIKGLHLHVSTKTRSLEIYDYLTSLFLSIVENFGLKDVGYFDIGGGFFGGIQNTRNWDNYLKTISNKLNNAGFTPQTLKLILEPGVSLIAGAFSYYTRVVDVKKTSRATFVTLDGSRIHIDPFFHKKEYYYILESNAIEQKEGVKQILAGFTCLEYDRFFEITTDSILANGDLFIFEKVGAYTMALSPLFISYYPSVFTKDSSGNISVLRERWSVNEYVQKSKI